MKWIFCINCVGLNSCTNLNFDDNIPCVKGKMVNLYFIILVVLERQKSFKWDQAQDI